MKWYFISGCQWAVITSPDATFKARSFPMIGETYTNGRSITVDLRQGLTASGQLGGLFNTAGSHIVGKHSVACKVSVAAGVVHKMALVTVFGCRGSTDIEGRCSGRGSILVMGVLDANRCNPEH
jgi:hypothetical protein